MSRRRKAQGFTLMELVVILFIAGLLFALIFPALRQSNRGPANRNSCLNKMRMIGLALANYESGQRRFPLVCFNKPVLANPARDCRPGDASGGPRTTGYSWIVAILPQLEENNLYHAIEQHSQEFSVKTGPFSPSIDNGNMTWQHASCYPIPALICPSWAGDGYTNSNATVDIGPSAGAPQGCGASEYATIDSATPGFGSQSYKGKVAPTNYKPMVGTHIRNGVPIENGGMLLTGPQGLTRKEFADRESQTILICETKESAYASWYDGTLNWLVGNDPNQPPLGSSDQPPWINAATSINRGFSPSVAGSVPYLKKSLTANAPQNDVWWGPSSDHAGGIVSHLFADCHTMGISDQCDPVTYLSLVTRSGGETIDETKIQ